MDEREGVEVEEEDDMPEEVEAGVRGEGVGDELPGHERNADPADGADASQGSAQWCEYMLCLLCCAC